MVRPNTAAISGIGANTVNRASSPSIALNPIGEGFFQCGVTALPAPKNGGKDARAWLDLDFVSGLGEGPLLFM